ncbi:VanZ family protein [Caulobacter hibisci]|uniref:VanZ family protein n=1 Tax=Caulobacter hibisci TaxID=2035993 RepID=A0ABS0SSG9_9CAUL|nr:VanZ family protein [Caulobacter hibisci]MBI1682518.1 VanZ family protein [Caulobacter hibisci]
MLTPNHVVTIAKTVLFLGAATAVTLMLGPFQHLEEVIGLSDKTAHAIAFGALTSLSFLSFPRMRRTDLAIAAVMLGASIEIAQLFTHRSASFGDLAADAIGVGVVFLASHIEAVRRDARERGKMTFAEMAAQDQRRRRRRRDAAAAKPTTISAMATERSAPRGGFAARASAHFPRGA